ncbi:unnamed protein product [Microthlaspi erraticum]|uniref:RNase H type-1 domain-containing protein n=1 Tax=Microthlaspi erraticum TaxID=1685480 RepID=A0A6D2LH46_9BRAS|nr:unnamed protein product [Microthlaspi erraticum]
MISARPLVHKGLIKRVGSGSSISVWYDPWISDSRPRSAICKGINYYPHLMVNQLINSQTSTWNLPLLHQLFESTEIARITGITIATGYRKDTCGWLFTKSGRYTVKSGYRVLQELADEDVIPVFGPDVRRLQAQSWKVKCTTKLQHFIWQIISGCLSVGARPPGLGSIPYPNATTVLSYGALFSNMAHLFWGLPKDDDMLIFPWLLWFIWKARNYKVFSNDDHDPPDVLESAITEARAWATAQTGEIIGPMARVSYPRTEIEGEWCQIDGAWKDTECRAGLGWYNFDPASCSILVGSCNLRRGLSPLQTELESLVWAMQSMLTHNKRQMNFQTDCSELVTMVSKPQDWPAFAILLEEVEKCKRSFQAFSLTHIPRTKNTKADKLARSARDQPYDVYYVNTVPPVTLPVPN